MMTSMTGYGESSFTMLGIQFYYRITSINSRFLEIDCLIPDEVKWFERRANELVRKRFTRGRLEICLKTNRQIPKKPVLNEDLVQEYQKLFCIVYPKKKADLPIETMIQLPGFFELRSPDLREYRSKIEFYFIKGLLRLERTQKQEGKKVQRLINIRLRLMKRIIKKIALLSQQHIKKQEKLISEKLMPIKTVLRQVNPNILKEDRSTSGFLTFMRDELFQALYSDITEEIERLKIHLESILQFIEEETSPGKKMEFFFQEMLREVNTLTSKTKNTEINLLGIQLKSEIEKIREHARNIV